MAGKVAIYNRALNLLGLEPISSITEDNKKTRSINLVYDQVLNELLIEEPWNFGTKRVRLARVADPIQTRCAYEYQYPANCLKLNKIYTDKDILQANQYRRDWEVIGDRICSDHLGLEAEYVYAPLDQSLYFAGFIKCLAYKLAIECCYKLINSTSREQALQSQYDNIILPKAISLDAQQEDPIEEVTIITEIGSNTNSSNVGGR